MAEKVESTAREIELMHHIKVLRSALEDAPHSSSINTSFYDSWYRQQRGPALESTDPDRWKPYESKVKP